MNVKTAAAFAGAIATVAAALIARACVEEKPKASAPIQVTTGGGSPIITSGGNVNFSYGVPVSLIEAWASALKEKGITNDQLQQTIANLSNQYMALRTNLEDRAKTSPSAARVHVLVQRGELAKAEAEVRAFNATATASLESGAAGMNPSVLQNLVILQLRQSDVPPAPASSPKRTLATHSDSFRIDGQWQRMAGTLGKTIGGKAGWLHFEPPLPLTPDDCLLLLLGGDAKRILVQFLYRPFPTDSPLGLQYTPRVVPPTRMIELRPPSNPVSATHIIVHGGPTPWGVELGSDNGPAAVQEIYRKKGECAE